MKKRKKRKYSRVKPSPELLEALETSVLELLRDRGGQEYWTNISSWIDNEAFINPTVPVQKEWIQLSNYGKTKVLGGIMDSLTARNMVSRKKNYFPYILTNVLDRMVKEMDKDGEAQQT